MDVTWFAVLVDCKDGEEFEIIGNAFQVKGVLTNAATSAAPLFAKDHLSFVLPSGMLLTLRENVRWMTSRKPCS